MDHRTDTNTPSVDDTIAAVSTPTGEGGIGIIRLSGPDAITLACRIFRKGNGDVLSNPRTHRPYYGHIIDPLTAQIVDEVLLTVMRAPASYTREDVVEISGHGGPLPLRAILNLVLSQDEVRLAYPGEFTRRAFLNGRIDLTQAEAVLDTIRARTDAGLRAAQRHLQGEIGRQVDILHQRLIALLASLEAAIDFADEELSFLTSTEIASELSLIQSEIQSLIQSHTQGRLLREGARAAIIGRPNTGKSSLLNALLGDARAIVTEIPGTTRDIIEEQLDLEGIPLRLVDTAGIRHTNDRVEMIGVERSRVSLEHADLILLVLDRAESLTAEDRVLLDEVCHRQVIIILNKADLPVVLTKDTVSLHSEAPVIELSTVTGIGMDLLRTTVRNLLLGGTVSSESPMLANLRQREAAERATTALSQAQATLDAGGTEELLAVDIMTAADALGEITGANIRDEVIDVLFARFCVGK